MIITIDGPVASGKSSLAKALAKELGFHYLSTGLLYRASAYVLMRIYNRTELTDEFVNGLSSNDMNVLNELEFSCIHSGLHVAWHGKELTHELSQRTYEKPASIIASHVLVREKLLHVQRDIASRYNIIADGRDCGTVVFPHAEVKFFLMASVDVRAQRLMNDAKRQVHESFDEIRASVMQRDERDKTRAVAPLCIPDEAIVIDNSTYSFEYSVAVFLDHVRRKIPTGLE